MLFTGINTNFTKKPIMPIIAKPMAQAYTTLVYSKINLTFLVWLGTSVNEVPAVLHEALYVGNSASDGVSVLSITHFYYTTWSSLHMLKADNYSRTL